MDMLKVISRQRKAKEYGNHAEAIVEKICVPVT